MNWGALRLLGPWLWVAAVALVGLLLAGFGQLRLGGYVLALSLVAAAGARLTMDKAGGLAVRHRPWVDAICYLGLALALAVAFTLVRLDTP